MNRLWGASCAGASRNSPGAGLVSLIALVLQPMSEPKPKAPRASTSSKNRTTRSPSPYRSRAEQSIGDLCVPPRASSLELLILTLLFSVNE